MKLIAKLVRIKQLLKDISIIKINAIIKLIL